MRRYSIDSSLTGTSRHIIGDEEGYIWSDSIPRNTWHLSGKIKKNNCLDTLIKITGNSIENPPEKYLNAIKTVVTGSSVNIPWQYVLPKDVFKNYFSSLVGNISSIFPSLPFDYYEIAWTSGTKVLESLRPACIDVSIFENIINESKDHHSPGLESFRPKRSGFAQEVIYDRFATRTGRLTVAEGPNILVLKKENRKILKSSFSSGKIVSFDFRALEARIVLAESEKYSDSEDIYDDISKNHFKGILPRDVVKTAVIAELYGISRGTLKSKLGLSDKKVDSFANEINEYFGINDLKCRLKDQVEETGWLINRFGRPIRIPEKQENLLINSYAQSSGVDVAMCGFNSLLEKLGTDGIRPLFVLHDAIILDVHPDRLKEASSINHVDVPKYEKAFPVKFEILNN